MRPRLAASEGARIGLPDLDLGTVPAWGGTARLTRCVGLDLFDNDYRHPVVLAKELATLDVLFEPRVRVDRLEEALGVFKGRWGDSPLTHEGEHDRITGHDGTPKPVQRPHLPSSSAAEVHAS